MTDTPIRFLCPHCLAGVSTASQHAGLTGRCPLCRAVIPIPGPLPTDRVPERVATTDFDCPSGSDYAPPAAASCPGIS